MIGERSSARYLIMDLALGASLALIPRRLCWSSRSTQFLAVSGIAMIGVSLAGRLVSAEQRGVLRVVRTGGQGVIGLSLIGAQYLLTEEESRVRAAIAGMGGFIVLLALLRLLRNEATEIEEYGELNERCRRGQPAR